MRRPLFIARQAGRPTGWLGRLIGRVMARETAPENATTLELLEIHKSDRVLEIGFGPGRAIARAATLASAGHVAGVEVSDEMLAMASVHNREAIAQGRVELRRADRSDLPYPDESFDRAYCVHALYFWPEAAPRLREISRVLRPGGRLVLTFRYGDGFVADLPAPVYVHRPPDQVASLLHEAGFRPVAIRADPPLYFAVAERAG